MNTGILNNCKWLIRVVFFAIPAFYMGLCLAIAKLDPQLNVRGYLVDSMKVWTAGCGLLILTECCTDVVWLFLVIFCLYLTKMYYEAFPFLWIEAD